MNKTLLLLSALTLTGAAHADDYFNDNLRGVKVCFSMETVSGSDEANALSPTLERAVHDAVAAQLRAANVPFTTDCKNSRYDLQVYIDTMDGPKSADVTFYTLSLDVFDYDLSEVGAVIYQDAAFGFTDRVGADFAGYMAGNVAEKAKVFTDAYRQFNR